MSATPDPRLPAIPEPTTDPASQLFVLTAIRQRIENLTAYLLALAPK